MTRPFLLLALALVCVGCATTPKTPLYPWPALRHTTLAELQARYPHADAVILEHEVSVGFDFFNQSTFTRWPGFVQRIDNYVAMVVLTEAGQEYANVTVPVRDGRIAEVQARTTLPSGEVHVVRAEEIYELEAQRADGAPGSSSQVKRFRLPRVEPGSVIEWHSRSETRDPSLWVSDTVSAEIPVEHYRLRASMRGDAQLLVKAHNMAVDMRREVLDDGDMQRTSFELHDVPAQRSEPFAPPAVLTEPRWEMVITRFAYGNRWLRPFDDWGLALNRMAYTLYTATDLYEGVTLAAQLGTCPPNTRCAVDRALALLQQKTELTGFGDQLFRRPLKLALAQGAIDNMEKAMLLRKLLLDVGVASNYAAVARDLARGFDPDFPAPGRTDHLVLLVKDLSDQPAPIFIDPSCETCRPGQLPPWDDGRLALVMSVPPNALYGERRAHADLVRMFGETVAGRVDKRTIDVTLAANGDAVGWLGYDMRGDTAIEYRIRTRRWDDAAWNKEEREALRRRATTARLRATAHPSWRKEDARLGLKLDWEQPGFAVVDGAQLVLPLTILGASYDQVADESQPRRHDVLVQLADEDEETLVVHLPPGFAPATLPQPLALHCDAMDGLVSFSAAPGVITIRRMVQLHAGQWGPAAWDDMAAIRRQLAAVRRQTLTLVKRAAP